MTTEYHNSGNESSRREFIIKNYLGFLSPTKEKDKFVCPVCNGNNLSVHKDGERYNCFDGCEGKKIAYELRRLNGEFNKSRDKDPLQVYKQDIIKPQANQSSPENDTNKLNTAPKVLAFLRKEFGGRIAYNVRSKVVEIDDTPFSMDCARAWIADKFGLDIVGELLRECLLHLSLNNQYDPVKRYLERCRLNTTTIWNLNTLAQLLFNRPEPLYNEYFKRWLIGCVARVYEPGCKFDQALVLQGAQGTYKTTFFREMAVDWFDNSMTGKLDKDDLMLLSKAWIVEWGELDGFTAKTYHGTIKHFLSRQEDNFRPPYARDSQTAPRRSVIVGTTNRSDFLNDPTSNRRFWIIPIEQKIQIEIVKTCREEIWASAVDAYMNKEKWELPEEFKEAQAKDNNQYEQTDPWEEILIPFLCNQKPISEQSSYEILPNELFMKLEEHNVRIARNKSEQMRIADIMKRNDWYRKKVRRGEASLWAWAKD